jgi:(p)ppGpp synthase/HD superfamily hydrolase
MIDRHICTLCIHGRPEVVKSFRLHHHSPPPWANQFKHTISSSHYCAKQLRMPTLEKALELAATHHAGQLDKAGEPYILHVLRVMHTVEGIKAKTVAAMHDLLEDTKVTEQDLRDAGFDAEIVDAVLALTKGPKETRIEAAKRAKINSLAREVKLADNADNMDLTRLVDPTEKDMLRMHEYVLVRKLLLS